MNALKNYRPTLTQMIFVGMALGLVAGLVSKDFAQSLAPLSTIFIRMIKSIIAPLIFATLVSGIAGHGNLKQVGRMGVKALVYFEIVTTLALIVGLVAVNVVQPGVGVQLQAMDKAAELASKQQSFADLIIRVVPQSIVQAAAEGEVLQVVFFAILFAFALALIPLEKRAVILSFCDSLAETMFKFTNIVMKFAPIGVGAAIAVTVGSRGLGVMLNLGLLVLTLYASLFVFIGVVFVPVAKIARIPLGPFFRTVKEPALIAFSTTSSEAALPTAFQVMESFGVPRRIVSFVLPTGYSFNLDGSAIYLSLASVFIAQAAGLHMPLETQALMALTLMLTSKGVAGVPRSSLVILAGTVASFHLPMEGVALVLGVDAVLDMGRTALNVMGNCLASAVIARWEGEFQPVVTGGLKT